MNLLLELVLVRKASQLWGFHFLLLNGIVRVQEYHDIHLGCASLNDRCYEN